MIVQSTLVIDKKRGTATLGHCCETTINGKMLSLEDIARCLVWHSPVRFGPYGRVMGLVRQQAAKIGASGVRVSDLTNTLFALGLYAQTDKGWGNPDTVVLVRLDLKGHLVKAEILGAEGSKLSEEFHAHKNDERTPDHLRAMLLSWEFGSLLDEFMLGKVKFDPREAKLRAERAAAKPREAREGKPSRGPGKRPIKPQFFQKRPPQQAANDQAQAPTRGERQPLNQEAA